LNDTQSNVRWLEACRLLDKYTMAWQCSSCGHRYNLSESERLSMQEAGEVPSRIRHQFDSHKCEPASRPVQKQPGYPTVQVDDIWTT
jgi:rubredoxin